MSAGRLLVAGLLGAVVTFAVTDWINAARVSAFEARERAITQEVQTAREAHAKAVAEALVLRAAVQAATAARDELIRKREVQRAATKRFGQRLVARTVTRLGREAGAAAPRSVPGAGVLVNASMLALTLTDACLTLRELSEVYAALDERSEHILTWCGGVNNLRLTTARD